MSVTIRFHLDEHIHPGIAIGLRARGVDVTTTQHSGLVSASDDDQLAFCVSHGRVMVTNDRDFLRFAASGRDHPGIAYCHQEKYSVGEFLHMLLLLHDCFDASEMVGRVEYL